MSLKLKYDADFNVKELLPDGSRLRIRLIRPEDKSVLVQGLSELSPQSRYLRFFTPKQAFSENELKHLTETDAVNHFALIAFHRNENEAEEQGAGVARFVRLPEEPTVAEPAIVVLDSLQSMGIGKRLLYHLHLAANERGIKWFEFDFLAENKTVRHILEKFADSAIENLGSGKMKARIPVLSASGDVPGIGNEVMSHAARGSLTHTLKRLT